ncbi:hypothetical protein PHYSODRAFT_303277 [Phytophthora sojae]|uniref:Uncharacterized protein n=1 Tax=Phytophthora sojae (strain P6497) TaxID=1094619 RepID=G4ZQX3_PHYSP|nr:hypothetical protein PHYSODRAFT_303277 [Phytophthora sojae]EGZ13921.1 hypothetical protein PHYSODRAFT_303277 [Phytophthora sojae]|eukprot:XP_009531350.1 hypothetical protein PHYSODRAFT_303277 [Phytophthora sojae]
MSLVFDFGHIEMAWWVAEDVRQHLVFKTLQIDKREIVVHTKFQDESVRRSIWDAIQRCPNDIQQLASGSEASSVSMGTFTSENLVRVRPAMVSASLSAPAGSSTYCTD